jgi:DNA-directed RNA polymerase subunit B
MRELIDAYFREKSLVGHQLTSFNDFVENRLQRVVDTIVISEDSEPGTIKPEVEDYEIKLGRISVDLPSVVEADGTQKNIFPMEARLRNITYASGVWLEFILYKGGMEINRENLKIGKLPVMIKSDCCLLKKENMEKMYGAKMSDEEYMDKIVKEAKEDPIEEGGYFIIGGTERVLISLEDLAPNRVLVEYTPKYGRDVETAKVFSQHEGYRALITIELRKDGVLVCTLPTVAGDLPLVILLKALGLESDEEIVSNLVSDPSMERFAYANIEECAQEHLVITTDDAVNYLGKKIAGGQAKEYRLNRVNNLLGRVLLPHLGTAPEDRLKKAIFLARMGEAVLALALDKRVPDDKDHYANKRIRLAGDLIEEEFRMALTSFLKDVKYEFERATSRRERDKRAPRLGTYIKPDIFTQRIERALATGNWAGERTGISQLLDRTSNTSMLSHLRRIMSPLVRSQPHFEARDLHPTQWGRLCPNETPEGPNCGLIKNLALCVEVTEGIDNAEVEKILFSNGLKEVRKGESGARVYLNGDLIGLHDKPSAFVTKMREQRRKDKIPNEINVRYNEFENEIMISCDGGRAVRPLIIVKNGKHDLSEEVLENIRSGRISWSDLVHRGIIEYLDAEEEEDAYIATDEESLTNEHTHLEIDPIAVLGVVAGMIPYPEHNSSPRNTIGSAMFKQSLGLSGSNYRIRSDTTVHLLNYLQRPLTQTYQMNFTHFLERPAGQNFVVAVLSYDGYNMEDAIVLNKSSIERGLGRSMILNTYETERKRYMGGQKDEFEIPPPDTRGVRAQSAYSNLDDDGIITPEVPVGSDYVLVGKTSPSRFLEEAEELLAPQKRIESSLRVKHGDEGVVDKVILTPSGDNNLMVKIRLRAERIPELGDKFASRHGQKGIIGLISPQENMPFNEFGIVPDIVVNPHGIPSRMTVGHILEALGGKRSALSGKFNDGTIFSGESEEDIRKDLKELGFKPTGKEVLYDGRTGRMYEADIFMGIIYYEKLYHMVADKMHARARGPVQILTRQPTEGRAREGGLRFGEMERDCLIGHGAAMVIKDRLLDNSDSVNVYVCNKCGHFAMVARDGTLRCPIHGDTSEIYPVETSYAFKLLVDELKSMCIAPALQLEDII